MDCDLYLFMTQHVVKNFQIASLGGCRIMDNSTSTAGNRCIFSIFFVA